MYRCGEKNSVVICDDGVREFMCVRGLDGKLECTSAFELSAETIAERELATHSSLSPDGLIIATVALAVGLVVFSIKKVLA